MYLSGAVALQQTKEPQSVQAVIHNNQRKFEQNALALHEAEEMINMQGPFQDAWALIAPESEVQRLEDELEKEHFNIEDYSEIPELNMPNRHAKPVANIELRQTFPTTHEIQLLLRQLNTDQKMFFYKIRKWCLDKVNGENPEPFQIFITGGAGTGKSHLIKCLYHETTKLLASHATNPDDIVVLLTAPTVTAAFNINGTTLHRAFSLPKSLALPYVYLRDSQLNKLRIQLRSLKILIIDEDEISMVGQNTLIYVNERLRQIKQSGNAVFGNICVIAVGDFFQLPPVRQRCLYDLRSQYSLPLWNCTFSLV